MKPISIFAACYEDERFFSEGVQLGIVAVLYIVCANWSRVVLVLFTIKIILVF
jgi:hypothetical protein